MSKQVDSEKAVERRLCKEMEDLGGLCIKLISQQVIGLPDRLCVFPSGKIIFVELKTTGRKPRRIQEIVHEKLRTAGAKVEVIDTLKGVDEFIEREKC